MTRRIAVAMALVAVLAAAQTAQAADISEVRRWVAAVTCRSISHCSIRNGGSFASERRPR